MFFRVRVMLADGNVIKAGGFRNLDSANGLARSWADEATAAARHLHWKEGAMSPIYRQGDVLIVEVAEIPKGKKIKAQNGRLILALGEVTGHHHSVAVVDAEMVETAEAVFLKIMRATPLEHQEHGSITLAPGSYRVIRQREYQPRALPRRVAD